MVFRKTFANEKVLLGNCLELPVREVEGVVASVSNAASNGPSSTALEEHRHFQTEGLRDGAFHIPNHRVDVNNGNGSINAAASAFHYSSSSSDSDDTLVGDAAGSKRNSLLSVKRRSLRSKSSTPTTENSAGKAEASPRLK